MPNWHGTRRRFITDVGGGIGTGAVIGLGFAFADAWLPHPTIAVVGSDTTQVVLLRTPATRIAMMLGPWMSALADGILPLLGWTNRRIDLLVLGASDGSADALAWNSNTGVVASGMVVGTDSATQALPAGWAYIGRRSVLELDAGVRLTFEPALATSSGLNPPQRASWAVLIERGSLRIWLASGELGEGWLALGARPTAVVVPTGDVASILGSARPAAIAVNADGQLDEPSLRSALPGIDAALVRTYFREPATFKLTDRGLQLPDWTSDLSIEPPVQFPP